MSSIESQPSSNATTPAIARRQFLGLSASAVLALTLGGWPQPVSADSNISASTTEGDSNSTPEIKERYRIFVPNMIVARGGSQNLTLRSGETLKVNIPKRVTDQTELTIPGKGLNGNNIIVVLHTLYEPTAQIQENIEKEINSVKFIQQASQENCKDAYIQVTDGQYCEDLATLDLLDYIVKSSTLDESIRQRYEIASQNSRLVGIEQAVETVLENSQLDKSRKTLVRGIAQYVRAADPIPDFDALTDLDTIVEGSDLPTGLKRLYAQASASSRAFTIDFLILDFIINSQTITSDVKEKYQQIYKQVRDGKQVKDVETLSSLDKFITDSSLINSCKFVYFLARTRFFDVDAGAKNDPVFQAIDHAQDLSNDDKEKLKAAYQATMNPLQPVGSAESQKEISQDTFLVLNSFMNNAKIPPNYKLIYQLSQDMFFEVNPELAEVDFIHEITRDTVKSAGGAIVPFSTNLLSVLGVEAGTGVTISSLSGAAATNATLAALGGGSIATGGFGMLGGLAVATGGAALIGAAGLLSIALVSQMDGEDLRNLGVAGLTGTLAGAAAVFVAWTGASVLGVAGTLSGAAAITGTISALGGLSVITGGASVIAFGTGFVVWSFLKGKRKRDNNILHQFEARLYTLIEQPNANDNLFTFLKARLPEAKYTRSKVFIAPEIPVNRLTTALDKLGQLNSQEKVLALIDSSSGDDAKGGILFTNQGLAWKDSASNGHLSFSEINIYFAGKVADLLFYDEDSSQLADVIWELHHKFGTT